METIGPSRRYNKFNANANQGNPEMSHGSAGPSTGSHANMPPNNVYPMSRQGQNPSAHLPTQHMPHQHIPAPYPKPSYPVPRPASKAPSGAQKSNTNQDTLKYVIDENKRIGHYIRYAKFLLLILVVGIGGWATFTKIGGAVIAIGKVAVEANVKSVQHLEGGIVREIAVKDGQKVQEGDILLRLDKKRVEDQLTGLESQAQSKKQQLTLLESELEDLKALADKGLVPKNRVVNQERQLAELKGEYGRLTSDISRLSTDKSRLEVRAPIGGRIHKLATHTIGGVVTPGQEILQIVPSDANLVFDANINPIDIDQVYVDQKVKVKLSSFNQRTTPELEGFVINVSPDLVQDEQTKGFFYVVQVSLKKGQIDLLKGKNMVPGMPAEIYIQTNERTVMNYLLKPLTDQVSRAMREE